MLLAVDPGIRGCGCAVLGDDSLLVMAAYVANPIARGSDIAACCAMAQAVVHHVTLRVGAYPGLDGCDALACEWPQVYAPGKQRGDPNDLLALVGVQAAIAALLPRATVSTYLPAQWKGQTPKDATRARVEARLSPEERRRVWLPTATSLQHNVFDAIGIALHHTGRFERHRHIAR